MWMVKPFQRSLPLSSLDCINSLAKQEFSLKEKGTRQGEMLEVTPHGSSHGE